MCRIINQTFLNKALFIMGSFLIKTEPILN